MGIFFRTKKNELLGNQFRLIEEVGKGSFGEVWHAERLSDGKSVAVKIPKDQEKGDEVLRKEADIIKDVNHPNIVSVFAFHNISGLFFIEMEYVDGYSLARILSGVNSGSPLSYKQMLKWTLDVLDGLAAVHSKNISHCDLKPENILIEKASNIAKIADFGVSRRFEDEWVWTKRHGTEAYMAPEVALEGKRVLISDIYSLGVLLYEMVTGNLPYTSPHQLLTGINVPKPREINSDVPVELESVILKAMQRRTENRYQNVHELNEDVKHCLTVIDTVSQQVELPSRKSPEEMEFNPPTSSPLYYLELAKKKLADGDTHGALEAAESAVNRSDNHPQYIRMLGGICLRIGYRLKAIKAYELLRDIYDRGYPAETRQRCDVIERLGRLYIDEQQYGKAIRIYEELNRLNSSAYGKFLLAIAHGLDGNYLRAIELLEDVRKERPDAVVVYNKLGWAHTSNGNDRLALSFYNQALAIDEYDLFSLYHLGKYYFITGEQRRADDYFKRVIEADKIGKYTEKIKKLREES